MQINTQYPFPKPVDTINMYLGVELDPVNKKYLAVVQQGNTYILEASKVKKLPRETDSTQRQLFQFVIEGLKNSFDLESLKNLTSKKSSSESSSSNVSSTSIRDENFFIHIDNIEVEERNRIKSNAKIILTIFFTRLISTPENIEFEENHRECLAKNLMIYKKNFQYELKIYRSPRDLQTPNRFGPNSSVSSSSLTNSSSTISSSKNVPKLTLQNESIYSKNLGDLEKTGLEYLRLGSQNKLLKSIQCQHCEAIKVNDTLLEKVKEKISKTEKSIIKKHDLLKLNIMKDVVERLTLKAIKEEMRINALAFDFYRNLNYLSIKDSENSIKFKRKLDVFINIENITQENLNRQDKRFSKFLKILLNQLKLNESGDLILNKWNTIFDEECKKSMSNETFTSSCIRFLDYISVTNSASHTTLFSILSAMLQNVYTMPSGAIGQVLSNNIFTEKEKSFEYKFISSSNIEFCAEITLDNSKDFEFPGFEIVIRNILNYTTHKTNGSSWIPNIFVEVIPKVPEKNTKDISIYVGLGKFIQENVVDPLTKVGFDPVMEKDSLGRKITSTAEKIEINPRVISFNFETK